MSSKLVVCCGDNAIFRIFKMAAAAILDFWNSVILLAIVAERVETHQHAKLCKNRTIGCEDIKIFFRFFKMAAATILECRIHKILLADHVRRSRRIIVLNFIKIGRSIAAILRFCKFSTWRPPPSWIFEIVKFYCGRQAPDSSACQISSK